MKANMVLVAAYGRIYATIEAAQAAWVEGKDFRIAHGAYAGAYCSVRDYEQLPNETFIFLDVQITCKVK